MPAPVAGAEQRHRSVEIIDARAPRRRVHIGAKSLDLCASLRAGDGLQSANLRREIEAGEPCVVHLNGAADDRREWPAR